MCCFVSKCYFSSVERVGMRISRSEIFTTVLLTSCVLWGCTPHQSSLPDQRTEQLVRNILLTNVSKPLTVDSTRHLDLYSELYQQAGIDSVQMDSLLRNFAQRPEQLSQLLDRIIAQLQQQLDSLDFHTPADSLQSLTLQEEPKL